MNIEQLHCEYKEEITCPLCGYEICDSWEYEKDYDNIYCTECGKSFTYERHVDVMYVTYCDEKAVSE